MLYVLLVLVIVGLVLYLVEQYVPMSPPIKTILRVVIVLMLCFWLLCSHLLTRCLPSLPGCHVRRHRGD